MAVYLSQGFRDGISDTYSNLGILSATNQNYAAAKDYFILRTPENAINKNLILTIYNLAGQVILSEKIEASNQFIDISKLHSAYYIYEISGVGIRTARNKLIVLPN